MKRRALALALLLVLLLTACGGKTADTPEPTPEAPAPSAAPAATPTPEPAPAPSDEPAVPAVIELVNPLTGLPMESEEQVTARPIAVMLNNIKIALPMQGNSQADILYECLAEGGITRLLGVYQSMEGVGEVGSIRSSRPYYLELALGLDAVYLHAGGSEAAYANIQKWNVTALDFVRTTAYNAIFWRDQGRLKRNGYEHSVLTSGDAIIQNFPKYSFRKEHEAGYSLPYTFAAEGDIGGEAASYIKVPFSGKATEFRYDADSKLYKVSEYGKPFVDGNNGDQIAVTNVIAIRTTCTVLDDVGRLDVKLSGSSGEGWFACWGKIVPIKWSKKGLNDPIIYTLADGTPITFGQGKSYVCVIPLSKEVTYEK